MARTSIALPPVLQGSAACPWDFRVQHRGLVRRFRSRLGTTSPYSGSSICVGVAFAILPIATRRSGRRDPRWRVDVSKRAGARNLVVNPESRVERVLRGTTVKLVDDLLEAESLDLLMSGAQSLEPFPEDARKMYCFMPEVLLPVPGAGKSQMRMLCSARLPRSGLAIINIEEFALLLEDAETGGMKFDETWSTRGSIRAETTNTLTYRQTGDDLLVVNSVRTSLRSPLPDWFTIGDSVFGGMVQGFVSEAFKTSQNEMLDKLEQRVGQLK